MSPTLLEAIVAGLLLWLAWNIGVLITPRVRRWFAVNFLSPTPRPGKWPMKNVTPESAPHAANPKQPS